METRHPYGLCLRRLGSHLGFDTCFGFRRADSSLRGGSLRRPLASSVACITADASSRLAMRSQSLEPDVRISRDRQASSAEPRTMKQISEVMAVTLPTLSINPDGISGRHSALLAMVAVRENNSRAREFYHLNLSPSTVGAHLCIARARRNSFVPSRAGRSMK